MAGPGCTIIRCWRGGSFWATARASVSFTSLGSSPIRLPLSARFRGQPLPRGEFDYARSVKTANPWVNRINASARSWTAATKTASNSCGCADAGPPAVVVSRDQVDQSVRDGGNDRDRAGNTARQYADFGVPRANRYVSIVFSSDQNGTDPKFVDFAKGADVLIMHLAIAPGVQNPLHATPAAVGRIAQEAGVGRSIVSHIGLFDLNSAIADLRKFYTGPLIVGADMQCTPVQ